MLGPPRLLSPPFSVWVLVVVGIFCLWQRAHSKSKLGVDVTMISSTFTVPSFSKLWSLHTSLNPFSYHWEPVDNFVELLFSCWVVSDSLRTHELQRARLPCPSLSRQVCLNCHSDISSSVASSSSCPQPFPASGSLPVSRLFASGGQSTGASASASVFPMNTQDWSPLGWTGLISLQCKGLSRVFSSTTEPTGELPPLWAP